MKEGNNYDSQGNLLAISPIWQAAAYNRPTTPLTHSGSVSHPTATQVRVGLMTALDEGWLAFESIKLSSLSAPITARPGQVHTLAAQVSGQVNGANAGRLFIKYSNGTIVNVWQNTGVYDDPQSVNGNFTTPTGVNSFQVGTAVTLDKGYLDFSGVTLTAYSAALPSATLSITAGGTYQFTGQVAGALAAPLGQGGRIVAVYANAAGQSAGEDLLWQNPTNFNGTVPVQQPFTANAGAVTLRLALTAVLDAGHLGFGDFNLQHLTAGDVIRRSTYMLAGQAVAVRVSGDPDGNDGLYYLYSDHLGSASAMQKSDGSAPIITRYLPFGGYRGGSGPNEVTDRGFTGQPENMDLGLYYYQARFYVPGIGRFASADSIVPDPTRPQQYNRYTYTLNNPLRYSDPTGHRSCSPEQTATGDETCDENIINNEWLAFRRRIQAQLTGRYGYYGNRKVVFASGPNEYTPKNVVTRPSSIPELHAMIAAGEQAVLSLGSPTTACHPLAGAMNGYSLPEFKNTWTNEGYRQPSINSVTDVLLFNPVLGLHSASVVLFDQENPENSILIQTNQGAHYSGIFFSRLGETNFEGIDGRNYIDSRNYIGLNLPERTSIKAVAVDQALDQVPGNTNEPIRR